MPGVGDGAVLVAVCVTAPAPLVAEFPGAATELISRGILVSVATGSPAADPVAASGFEVAAAPGSWELSGPPVPPFDYWS